MKYSLIPVIDKIMLRKRILVESVNDKLKNIAQIEHLRHQSSANFITNTLSAIAAYCFLPKKPSISLEFITELASKNSGIKNLIPSSAARILN